MSEDAKPFTRTEHSLSIGILRAANVFFTRLYHHVEVHSACTLPYSGAGILVSNHLSSVDPALIQSACPRLIRWMMAAEYYKIKSIRWLFKLVGTIQVDRNGRDSNATRQALRALDSGYFVGMFPEGRIETARELLPFHPGAVILAGRAGVPIHPVFIEGTQRGKEMIEASLKPNRTRLWFGKPLTIGRDETKGEGAEAAMLRVREAIENLRQMDQRARQNIN